MDVSYGGKGMRPVLSALVIFAFAVPVFGSSYVSVLKCGGENDRFELFLDKDDSANAMYTLKSLEFVTISDVQVRKLKILNDKGDDTVRLALSYTKTDDTILYNDITKKVDLKLGGQSSTLDCTLTANNNQEPVLYKLQKL
jgi:hypothetical protein